MGSTFQGFQAPVRAVCLVLAIAPGFGCGGGAAHDEPATTASDGSHDEGAVVVEHNVDVIFDQVYFDADSAELRDGSGEVLAGLADALGLATDARRVACIGHAARDESDPDALSEARAEAVCAALRARGVAPERLDVHGAGARMPVTGGESGRPYDPDYERRVELLVMETTAGTRYYWDDGALRVAP